jgi:hypothetical protein
MDRIIHGLLLLTCCEMMAAALMTIMASLSSIRFTRRFGALSWTQQYGGNRSGHVSTLALVDPQISGSISVSANRKRGLN